MRRLQYDVSCEKIVSYERCRHTHVTSVLTTLSGLSFLHLRKQRRQQQQTKLSGKNNTKTNKKVTALKDAIEDFHRHKADSLENCRTVRRIVVDQHQQRRSGRRDSKPKHGTSSAEWQHAAAAATMSTEGGGGGREENGLKAEPLVETENVSWKNVHVGDLLEVRNRENIPADIVMLSCSDPRGTCFVMTSNLDGETNLKPRIVSPDLRAVMAATAGPGEEAGGGGDVLGLAARKAVVECDLPNQKLEHFDGTVVVSLFWLGCVRACVRL